MTNAIYCAGCNIKVMMVVEGSTIKRGAVVLCANCEMKRKMSDLSKKMHSGSNTMKNPFDEMFGAGFR